MRWFDSLRLDPDDLPYGQGLKEVLVLEMYNRSRVALLALVILLVMVRAILGPLFMEVSAVPWMFGFLAIVIVLRVNLAFWVLREPRRLPPDLLHNLFILGAGTVGIGLAIILVIVFPHLDSGQAAMMVICQTAVNSVAMVSMAPSLIAYLTYMLPNMGALVILVRLYPHDQHAGVLFLLLCVYLIALLVLAYRTHASIQKSFLLTLKLQDLALKDSLTGLRNRRFLMEFMAGEAELVLRTWDNTKTDRQSLAILMLDLDHFKTVNDTYGHAAGDAVIQQLTRLLTDSGRSSDLVSRWGGEEFVIIARGTDRDPPLKIADRIRERVAKCEFVLPSGKVIHNTCSIGYGLYPFLEGQPQLLNWEQVLSIADAGLYEAKREGRDRACGLVAVEQRWDKLEVSLGSIEWDPQQAAKEGLVKIYLNEP